MTTHIKALSISNSSNKIISVKCDKKTNDNSINTEANTSLSILPGEIINLFPGYTIEVKEEESFTITITEAMPGKYGTKEIFSKQYVFYYSIFSDATASIYVGANNNEPYYYNENSDHANDHIRKFTLKNPTGDSGYAIKLKVNYTMPNGSTGNYTTGSYAISNSKTVDLVSGVKLPDGTKVQLVAIGCASGKSDAKAKQTYYVYKDSTREAKYNFKGHWKDDLSVSLQSYK